MVITTVDNQFVRLYDLLLKTQCGCHHNSALKHMKNLKKIIRIGENPNYDQRSK